LCIGKRVSGQTGHLFWDGGSINQSLSFMSFDFEYRQKFTGANILEGIYASIISPNITHPR
jgi:hypothetical protein